MEEHEKSELVADIREAIESETFQDMKPWAYAAVVADALVEKYDISRRVD